jgi:hypothetical protein
MYPLGVEPTIVCYNAMSSLVRFGNKNMLFYFKKTLLSLYYNDGVVHNTVKKVPVQNFGRNCFIKIDSRSDTVMRFLNECLY